MSRRKSSHYKALEKIASNPEKFGFKDIISASIETNLFDKRKQLVAQPDIILISRTGTIHLIEYKGNGDEELLRRANNQLRNAVWWYGRYTDTDPDKLKTHIISGSNPKYKEALK